MKTLVVVQARMGSSRLPGKVLLPLAGRPLLERMLQRLQGARFPFELCVATSTLVEDEPIRQLCKRIGVSVVSGHPSDLLQRHLLAAQSFAADVVVKVPSDCPLIDPTVIDQVWPDGHDVEVMPRAAPRHEGDRPTAADFHGYVVG